jgi:hypothetical protein
MESNFAQKKDKELWEDLTTFSPGRLASREAIKNEAERRHSTTMIED